LGKKEQKKESFSLPANVLRDNSQKESIRKLNEEFRLKDGRVSFKSTTKGQSVKLSHPDVDYLDDFRLRLMKECGLLEEEEEQQQGEKKTSAGSGGEPDSEDKAPEKKEPVKKERPRPRRKDGPPARDEATGPPPRSDPDHRKVLKLIEEAVVGGAIDDGQIIKFSYTQNAGEKIIGKLRKKLWGNKCRLGEKKCRFKRKQINFEETMKSCKGVRNECEHIESDLLFLFPQWKQNVDDMFEEFNGKVVRVKGKISYSKFIEREEGGTSHYKLLIYDTLVNNAEDPEDKDPKETRKLWAKLTEEEFDKLNKKQNFKLEDIVEIQGTITWNNHFFDYWIADITEMTVTEQKGEMPIKP